MQPIGQNQKIKIARLFLTGLSYDEIAQQVGVAKGSVVNVVAQFRDGTLAPPPGMAEYIDSLRHLAVDLMKHNTTVTQVKTHLKICLKLQQMGVGAEQVEQALDICQDIASPEVSNNKFVSAALELAHLMTINGVNYQSLIQDYENKLKIRQSLDQDIAQRQKLKEQASKQLVSITKAMGIAQDNFANQKADLKAQLDDYLAQNKLDWHTAKIAHGLLSDGLGEAGLSQEEQDKLCSQIAAAASLQVTIGQLEQKQEQLTSEVSKLNEERNELSRLVDRLNGLKQWGVDYCLVKAQEAAGLDARIESDKALARKWEESLAHSVGQIRLSFVVTPFLDNSAVLKDWHLDWLVPHIETIRQKRLGLGLK